MISLVPLQGLGVDPTTTAPSPTTQRLHVRALSSWNALILGVVTGFAMSAGTLIFNKLANRFGWK